eukprot:5747771-Pyramimonas_sp.AAC.1
MSYNCIIRRIILYARFFPPDVLADLGYKVAFSDVTTKAPPPSSSGYNNNKIRFTRTNWKIVSTYEPKQCSLIRPRQIVALPPRVPPPDPLLTPGILHY